MIAISWRQDCPDIRELIAYAARQDAHEFGAAFSFHLEKDHCRWCNAVVSSTMAATAPFRVATGLLRLRPAKAFGFATEPESDEELATERTSGERLVWTLYERPDHEVMLEVESPDSADDGRPPKALLSGATKDGFAVTEEIELPALGWNGHLCRNRHALGMAADLAAKFGEELRVAVWFPELKS
jgi:hypothetical protein